MIEVSRLLFMIIIEGFSVVLVVLSILLYSMYKKRQKDKEAVRTLLDQLQQQSKVRMEKTGSFLSDKYRFEGNDLKKAVKSIDKAEKKFMKKLIHVYLQRDSDKIVSMDAWVAELIETYKELSPVMPEAEVLESIAAMESGHSEVEAAFEKELSDLRESKEKLIEELSITKTTMGNMISEFGNMFGGGSDNELEKGEVIDKVSEGIDEEDIDTEESKEPIQNSSATEDNVLEEDSNNTDDPGNKQSDGKKNIVESTDLSSDDVNELMDSLDLSE